MRCAHARAARRLAPRLCYPRQVSRYTASTDHVHDGSATIGVLLVNHGSPDAPDKASVRRYLARFLADPRLIEMPRLPWLALLHGVILRTRPRRTAKAYQSIWGEDGSPMARYTKRLAGGLAERLAAQFGPRVRVAIGMRYGNPDIESAMLKLRGEGAQRLIVLPLYPQYTATTVGTVFDEVTRVLQGWRWVPELRFVSTYHDDEAYLDALAASVRAHWREYGRGERLVLSFHGIPQAYADAGDPYYCFCHHTARQVAERLDLADDEWRMSFHSKFGPGEWLRPYLDDAVDELRVAGARSIDVVCPGFAVDCLETLKDIRIELAERLAPHGVRLGYIPCLNDGGAHQRVLAGLVRRQLAGWDEALSPVSLAAVSAGAPVLGRTSR